MDGRKRREVSLPSACAWARNRRKGLGLTGAAAAAAMTGVWIAIVPDKVAETSGLQELAIRWGHPACWALLAVVGVLFAMDAPKQIRDGIGMTAAACYVAFLAAMLL